MEVSKVQLEYWHATMPNFKTFEHDQPLIKPIIPRVVVVDNKEGVFHLRRASTQ
jgi:hypothetical protein